MEAVWNTRATKKGWMSMDKWTFESFYDRICFALTAYECIEENEDACDPEYDRGFALYQDIVDIVNDMAASIN